jgi:hypothetical protein
VRLLTLALAAAVAVLGSAPASANSFEATRWDQHPGAYLALLVTVGGVAIAGLASLVCLLGAVAPSVHGASDRQARRQSPGWATVVGALVGFGVLACVSWAAGAGKTPGAVAALALGVPALLLALSGATAVVPLLGERVLGERGPTAAPLRRAFAGAAVVILALAASLAVPPLFVALAIAVVGWSLGTGLGAALAGLRRPPR